MKKLLSILFSSTLLMVSCSDDDTTDSPVIIDGEDYTSGSADFSNYVSVGNSLTAGYSDQALFIEGQTNSFPNMLATKFALAGGGDFSIPFMADNLGGATLGGQTILGNRLFLDFSTGSPNPVPVSGTGTTEISTVLSGPFNNMGVPGSKIFHLAAPGYGNVQGVALGLANPYYARFASSSDATIIGDAVAQNPTFFSLWIGSNDILSFALAGGAGEDQTGNPDPSTYGSNDITDPDVFAYTYNALLQGLTANGAKGVTANIPNVTSLPHFTTVPHNPVPLDEATAAQLNAGFAAYNNGLLYFQSLNLLTADEVAKRTISFTAGTSNPVVILDEDLTDLTAYNAALTNMRQATAEDLIVLTARSFIGSVVNNNPALINGVSVPLEDKWVLTPEEQTMITTATVSYNQTIAALAGQYGLAFFDANSYLEVVATTGVGLTDGSTVTSTYATGGAFSLDGVHPSPRGYALIANQFTAAINTTFGSNLPDTDPLEYKGLYIN